MIEIGFLILGVGFFIMIISFLFAGSKTNISLLLVVIGAFIAFIGLFILPLPTQDFCDEQEGIYKFSDNLILCSIPDSNGDYITYQIIKVEDEYKLSRFSEVRLAKEARP